MADTLFVGDIHTKEWIIDLADKVSKYDDMNITKIVFMRRLCR